MDQRLTCGTHVNMRVSGLFVHSAGPPGWLWIRCTLWPGRRDARSDDIIIIIIITLFNMFIIIVIITIIINMIIITINMIITIYYPAPGRGGGRGGTW